MKTPMKGHNHESQPPNPHLPPPHPPPTTPTPETLKEMIRNEQLQETAEQL